MDKQTRYSIAKKVSAISFSANVLLAIFKVIAGVFGHSTAVIADASESLTDAISSSIVWISIHVANKPSDFEHPYGHHRIETVSSLIVGIIIFLVGLLIVISSARHVISGEVEIPTNIALAAVIISGIINEIFYQYTVRIGKKISSSGLVAVAHDFRKDALTGLIALTGVVGSKLGVKFLDPVAAIVIAIIILRIGFKVSWSSINELLDITPDSEILVKIRKTAQSVTGVEHVKRFRARKTGPYIYVDVEIEIDESMSVLESHKVAEEVKSSLRNELPNIRDIMVHIEPHAAHE
jgi:cation diffusion facilitator family transporter